MKPTHSRRNSLAVTKPTTLLAYLLENLTHLKRTKIKQILKFGSVLVNGHAVTLHSRPLKTGDRIEFLNRKEASIERIKQDAGFPILHEDSDLIVVDKPSGLLTTATEKEKEETLYFKLTDYCRSTNPDSKTRIFIVHRLDRDSSGVMVFAKNEDTKLALQDKWDKAVKRYYALVEGVPNNTEGTIRSNLHEDKSRKVWATQKPREDSRHAITHYKVTRQNDQHSLLDIHIETGRKNQIRVQLASIGHPVTGDYKYGAKSNPIRRLALHAYALSFPHPTSGTFMSFRSELPQIFIKTVAN